MVRPVMSRWYGCLAALWWLQGVVANGLVGPREFQMLRYEDSSRVVDCRPPEKWRKERIPDAISLYWRDQPFRGEFLKLNNNTAKVVSELESQGISSDDTILLYGDRALDEARMFWMFEYLGVGHSAGEVYMLDGGITAWKQASFPVASGSDLLAAPQHPRQPIRQPSRFVPTIQHHLRTTLQELQGAFPHPCSAGNESSVGNREDCPVLLDVRKADEYFGRATPNHEKLKGHIPGALWMDHTQLLRPNATVSTAWVAEPNGTSRQQHRLQEAFVNRQRSRSSYFVSRAEGWAALRNSGVMSRLSAGKGPLVVLCTGGVRSALAYVFIRYLAAMPDVRLFDGSMLEWTDHLLTVTNSTTTTSAGQRQSPSTGKGAPTLSDFLLELAIEDPTVLSKIVEAIVPR